MDEWLAKRDAKKKVKPYQKHCKLCTIVLSNKMPYNTASETNPDYCIGCEEITSNEKGEETRVDDIMNNLEKIL